MPAQVLIDENGLARFVHYGHSMSDIPEDEEIFGLADRIDAESGPEAGACDEDNALAPT